MRASVRTISRGESSRGESAVASIEPFRQGIKNLYQARKITEAERDARLKQLSAFGFRLSHRENCSSCERPMPVSRYVDDHPGEISQRNYGTNTGHQNQHEAFDATAPISASISLSS